MFFLLSKLLGFFFEPSNLLIIFGLAGTLLLPTRWRRAGVRVQALALVLLAVVGLSPLGRALLLPLEDRFPPWTDAGPPRITAPSGGARQHGADGRR